MLVAIPTLPNRIVFPETVIFVGEKLPVTVNAPPTRVFELIFAVPTTDKVSVGEFELIPKFPDDVKTIDLAREGLNQINEPVPEPPGFR